MATDNKSEWYNLFLFILRNKKLNLWFLGLMILSTILIVFFILPKQYTAEISILPTASVAAQQMSGKLGSLANLAGIDLGSATIRSPEMYKGILFSRSLLQKIIFHKYFLRKNGDQQEQNLIEFLESDGKNEEEKIQKTLKILREEVLAVNIDQENMILYVYVTLKNPDLAADVANLMINELDDIVLKKVQNEYAEQFNYIKMRSEQIKDSLATSEKELQLFLETNPDPTLPNFQIEQLRLKRQLEIQSALFIELRKQLEMLHIQNFINLSPIKTLDTAFSPYRKSRPKRLFVLITLLALFGFIQFGANGMFYLYGKFSKNVIPELRKREDVNN